MKFLITPDYGLSDIWHFNYPLKHLLSESLKSGHFPLWTDLVGNGFPIAAEGQIGAFSPVNWVIFGVLPMPLAFMIALWSTFLIAGIGAYFFARTLRLSRFLSVAAAAFASVNGYSIAQMTHLNLLQSFAFIPWAFYFFQRYIQKKQRRDVLWLSMTLTQMILVGYPQTMVNTVIMLIVFGFIRPTRMFLRLLVPIGASGLLALFLSAVQIVPLVELARESDTAAIAARQRFIHPLLPSHLLNVIHPFFFGNPSVGTYQFRGPGKPVFWENLLYVGIMPLLLLVFSLMKKKSGHAESRGMGVWPLVILTFVSLLLSLGKFSPLGLFFKVFPLSATRVESRFLSFTHFGFAILAAIALSRWKLVKKWKQILVVIAVLHITQVLWVFRSYHLFDDAKRWMTPPEIIKELSLSARIVTMHQENIWDNFAPDTNGWRGKQDELVAARATLGANSNIIFGIRQLGVYAQQYPRRQRMVQFNLYRDDVLGQHIRQVFGVTHLLDAESGSVRVAPTLNVVQDLSLPSVITQVSGPEEALGRMAQDSFQPGMEVLWESSRMPNDSEQIVVINRSFYPGWKAFVEKKEIPIYPVNINQQAIVAPKGAALTSLRFVYDLWSFKVGGAATLTSLVLWIVLVRRFR